MFLITLQTQFQHCKLKEKKEHFLCQENPKMNLRKKTTDSDL